MFYEVNFPSNDGSQRTLQVSASSWMAALKTSIQTDSGTAPSMENWFVDVGGDAIIVTDPTTRQTYRLRELDKNKIRESQMLKALTGSQLAVGSASKRPTGSGRHRPIGFKDRQTGAFRSIVSTEIQKPKGEDASARVVADTVEPKPTPKVNDSVVTEVPDAKESQEMQSISETALEDVFLEITSIFEPEYAMEDAIDFVLDLAMKYVPSATGGLMFASDSADSLYFAATRGAGKKKLLKGEYSIREGVPARALKDGLALAVAQPKKDGRYTDELAEKGGFEVKSITAAPIQSGERAFGVLVLVNREDRSFYSQYDANIVAYIGQQMGKFIQDQLDAAPLE